MKNQLFLCCTLAVFAFSACSKKTESDPTPSKAGNSTKEERLSGFSYTKSTPSGNWISSSFIDENNGYIAGTGGSMIKTTNGGTTWTPVTGLPACDLYGCYFFPDYTGFVVGNYNTAASSYTAYKTPNGGTSWTPITLPATLTANVSFRSIYFYNSSIGFIGGGNGTVLKTTNGGTTWDIANTGIGSQYAIYSFTFFNEYDGLAAGSYGTMFKTTDGGTTWSPSSLHVSRSNLSCVTRVPNTDSAYVTTSIAGAQSGGDLTTFLYTANKGASWTKVVIPGTKYQALQSVKLFDLAHIYMVGGNVTDNTGIIYSSTNFGSWNQEVIPACGRLCTAAVYEYSTGNGVLFAAGLNNSVIKGQ